MLACDKPPSGFRREWGRPEDWPQVMAETLLKVLDLQLFRVMFACLCVTDLQIVLVLRYLQTSSVCLFKKVCAAFMI